MTTLILSVMDFINLKQYYLSKYSKFYDNFNSFGHGFHQFEEILFIKVFQISRMEVDKSSLMEGTVSWTI